VTDYLTLAEVRAMHEDLIARYGGSPGIRDLGLLEAALFRPQSGYYKDLIAEAAALWESLSQNHLFVDGNKRVAFAAMYTFLRANGMTLTADADTTFAFVDCLYQTGRFSFNQLEPWLRAHTSSDRD
jgi:death-on-curing protein